MKWHHWNLNCERKKETNSKEFLLKKRKIEKKNILKQHTSYIEENA